MIYVDGMSTLNKKQVNKLESVIAKQSDFASFINDGIYANRENCNYWISDEKFSLTSKDRKGYYVTKNGEIEFYPVNSSYGFSTRLTIPYTLIDEDEIFNELRYGPNNNFIEKGIFVKYGEYPQERVNENKKKELEMLFNSNRISKTGKKYQIKNDLVDELEYNGNKYIRFTSKKDRTEWFQVTPIIWIVNEKEKNLISRDCLVGRLNFDEALNLPEIMKKDIMPSKKIEINEDLDFGNVKLSEEATELINKIYENIKYANNKKEILLKVREIVENYQNSLNNLRPDIKTEQTLELKSTLPTVYVELIKSLNGIYYDTFKKNLKYYQILDKTIQYLEQGIKNELVLDEIIAIKTTLNSLSKEMNENYSYELKKILINYSNKKVEVENIGMEYLDELRNELVSFSFILNQAIKVNIENKTSEDIMNNIKTLTSNIGVNEIEISNIKNVTHSNEIRILMCMQSFIEDIINYYNIVHKELDEQSKIILKENLTTTLIKCGEKINEDLSYENLKEVAGLYYRFKTMADESINYCKNISRLN